MLSHAVDFKQNVLRRLSTVGEPEILNKTNRRGRLRKVAPRQLRSRRVVLVRIGLTATISLILLGSAHAGLLCDSKLIAPAGCRVEQSSDFLVVKDHYTNHDYGYSVRIPKG